MGGGGGASAEKPLCSGDSGSNDVNGGGAATTMSPSSGGGVLRRVWLPGGEGVRWQRGARSNDRGGRRLHSNRSFRMKAAYCILRRGSDCGSGSGGGGSDGGTMAHSLWETAYEIFE